MRISMNNYIIILFIFIMIYSNQSKARELNEDDFFNASRTLFGEEIDTSEEILLLAHKRDTRAMVLASFGYATGIAGFPNDTNIARIWSYVALLHNGFESSALINLIVYEETVMSGYNIGMLLSQCDIVQSSDVAEILSRFGLFNVNQVCSSLDKYKENFNDWRGVYDSTMQLYKQFIQQGHDVIRIMRTLRERYPTQLEESSLKASLQILQPDVLVFFAATSHDIQREVPDWNASYLIHILDMCRSVDAKWNEGEDDVPFFSIISDDVASILNQIISKDDSISLDAIRIAHNNSIWSNRDEFIQATRTMSSYYHNGSFGFLKNEDLSRSWLLSAAFDEDPVSMLNYSVEMFNKNRLIDAFYWVMHAKNYTQPDTKLRMIVDNLLQMIEEEQPGMSREERERWEAYSQGMIERARLRSEQSGE